MLAAYKTLVMPRRAVAPPVGWRLLAKGVAGATSGTVVVQLNTTGADLLIASPYGVVQVRDNLGNSWAPGQNMSDGSRAHFIVFNPITSSNHQIMIDVNYYNALSVLAYSGSNGTWDYYGNWAAVGSTVLGVEGNGVLPRQNNSLIVVSYPLVVNSGLPYSVSQGFEILNNKSLTADSFGILTAALIQATAARVSPTISPADNSGYAVATFPRAS